MKYMTFVFWCFMIQAAPAQIPDTSGYIIQSHVMVDFTITDYEQMLANHFDVSSLSAIQTAGKGENLMDGIFINYLPGLFCRIEHHLESKSKIATRFRLGSYNYTQWMEGKKDFYTKYDR